MVFIIVPQARSTAARCPTFCILPGEVTRGSSQIIGDFPQLLDISSALDDGTRTSHAAEYMDLY